MMCLFSQTKFFRRTYIINLTLQSNVTMLRTINRVSKLFKESATTAMYNRCLHISDNVADALGLVYVENTVSVRKPMRYACPGSDLAYRLRDIMVTRSGTMPG